MRLFGHPLHVMLVHFPVALWPAHECLHLFASYLPPGASAIVGFWLLISGTAIGWMAALFGASDLVALWKDRDEHRLHNGLIHAAVNGSALTGFTIILALEYGAYPNISHGVGLLSVEAGLILFMFAGNYFGGAVIWGRPLSLYDKKLPEHSRN